ncbi:hypothetical protein MNEG_3491 [Monoraphidium neglectum]|uniref:Glycoside-hydrolase family GH114 TIM-barrel domain-containing protein n=1 Tax=Monoraphidium neglectum TaxID=145388 RepID=A0A0D2MP37_9CHLO|nr:hypothetical protein MNEG_3491 [Monoraphidium neglectum]KIZ04460.1 hypothetical protein MNEG_3491 [Monoraphidium neglectum]|eukprot:XP_013903479.1 hypothetical protein MNEG_3491 [Monoraphidium neglectum]
MAFAVGPAKSTCEYILATALVAVCLVKAAAAPATATWWQPSRNEKFQYQLSVALDPDKHFIPGVQVYIVDAFDTPADAVAALKAKGDASAPVVPVCYISAGTWEDWRPDAGDFADSDKGAALGNWPGEYYANLRSDNVRAIMRRRMEMCRDKGFLAVDADNVDAYSNANGLGLTAEDQLDYNTWLAATAHELGLGMGLKNNLNQMAQLAPLFDFFVNE